MTTIDKIFSKVDEADKIAEEVSKAEAMASYKKKDELEEAPSCERCGGECSSRLVGDEFYNFCSDCNSVSI